MSFGTHAKQQEALFVFGVFFIEELNSKIIVEDRLRLLKGNAMFSLIGCGFGRVPFKTNHTYIVLNDASMSSRSPVH